jgi:hypothetical protein
MHLFESTSWYHLKNVTYKQNQKKKKQKKKKKKERRERAQLFQSKMLNLLLNE